MIMYPFSANGVRTRVFEAGEAGTPLVLLHGLTSRADRWSRNMDVLAAAGYHVFAPDLPGHGFAEKGGHLAHSITGYRDFVLGFLDRIGAGRAVLIGTSLGGHVMGAVAAQAPDRVDALVMIGSLGLSPLTEEKIERMRRGIGDMSLEGMRGRLLNVYSDPALVTDDLVKEDVLVNTSPGARESFDAFLAYMAEGFNRDLVTDALAGLGGRFPHLLLWGEEDGSVPVDVGRTARTRLPEARLVTLAGVNHTPYFERPDLFNPVVLEFLAGRLGAFQAPEITYG